MNLLLLPGLMCDHSAWQPLFAHWQAGRYKVVVADYGAANSLPVMASTAVLQAQAAWGSAPFAVLGHSMGGRVALELVRAHSASVTHLGLFSTGCTAVAAGEVGAREIEGRMALLNIARTQSVRVMAIEWAQAMVASNRLDDIAFMSRIYDMMARKTADIFAAQINALIHRADTSEVIRQAHIPILFLTGQHDGWANAAQHQAMFDLCSKTNLNAELLVIEGAGHMVTMEAPAVTAGVIDGFLQKRRLAST